jgi:hypothetical protein
MIKKAIDNDDDDNEVAMDTNNDNDDDGPLELKLIESKGQSINGTYYINGESVFLDDINVTDEGIIIIVIVVIVIITIIITTIIRPLHHV